MILHHYSVSELRLLITKVKKRLYNITKEIAKLEPKASYMPYFKLGEVEVDSIAFLEFLDQEKEGFEAELLELETQLFKLQIDLE